MGEEKFKADEVLVIGGGLAGVEAALQLANRGIRVLLREMKPVKYSEAHSSPALGELVCSNSLKAMGLGQASGLLQEEMSRLGSVVIETALNNRVAAGQALAVNREDFSKALTRRVEDAPLIELVRGEATTLPNDRYTIAATGPLTSEPMAEAISSVTGDEDLYFYDAMAPIIEGDSIDRSVVFAASRYEKGGPDYLNCPMTREEFGRFFAALTSAEIVPTRNFEKERVFQGCQPIETLAAKGEKTLLFGPMKPVGFIDPRTGKRPHALLQLRREDEGGQRWNMVGFQTKLTYPEQKRVFRLIPGLQEASFYRLGSLHRNTYVDGPRVLDGYLRARRAPWIQFAGQITGVEGYLESAAMGIWAGLNLALRLSGKTPDLPPEESGIGALVRHVYTAPGKRYEPMNMNFGILPPLGVRMKDKKESKRLRAERALEALDKWIATL
ncbi:MAG: methylenetetrahydrofolate--tRNA-(uracil(54)-C(5))-methyltransferase (FADH(2)-oxidizing) TrmFO [Deltaproteobacteria bacterium]|nr:MAG: methylenetetrahydrofolate--tRNA-(uracil(54)-C(5))-methyltransferase (FADH(2)-oxidizing) TrmFO [Deltaproteobacteria bacterium]